MTTGIPTHEKIVFDPAVNRARQSLYRFAALSLADPRSGSWQQLHKLREDPLIFEAATLLRGMATAVPEKLSARERPLADLDPAPVLTLLPVSPKGLNRAYEQVFGLLASSACPSYETEHINDKFTFQRSQTLADISGFYAAFGFTTSLAHPERHDHIVLELEFMALLLGLERLAFEHNPPHPDRGRTCRHAQKRFLTEHLAWWATGFAKLLIKEDTTGYFAAAGKFLAALIPAERALADIPAPQTPSKAAPPEGPEVCLDCLRAT